MRLIPTALTATLALQVTCACATENPQDFRIMEPAEITRHLNAMQKLDGEEREQYRDRIYAELRERARSGGYGMPATPPWKQQQPAGADLPQAIPAEPATMTTNPAVMKAKPAQAAQPIKEPPPGPDTVTAAPDMQKLVARQKQVIEEAGQQLAQAQSDLQQKQALARPQGPPEPAPPGTAPAARASSRGGCTTTGTGLPPTGGTATAVPTATLPTTAHIPAATGLSTTRLPDGATATGLPPTGGSAGISAIRLPARHTGLVLSRLAADQGAASTSRVILAT